MTIWITSDTHFGHAKIIDYENRPFRDVEEMNESLILRWNNNVKPLDIVYHLGDFGLGPTVEMARIRNRLNGSIVLVKGNHDDSLSKLLSIGFSGIADRLVLHYKYWEFTMTHVPQQDLLYDEMSHGMINLHGHVHGKNRATRNRINVSCDAWDYTPVTLDDLMMEYRKQRKTTYD
jgi:calcineurin-like phosphoesterase family protein